MSECSACGTKLAPHEIRCSTCGKVTAQYHRQKHCMHCGSPVAHQAKTCIMCQKPVDSLPLDQSIFSGSWIGIAVGVLIIIGLVVGFNNSQRDSNAETASGPIPSATSTLTPSTTPTMTRTPELPTPTPTNSPTPTITPRVHAVESGQTLLFIAQRYGVPLNVLLDLNNMTGEEILSVGQGITIPPALSDTGRPLQSGNELPPQIVYSVQTGDTLSDIAYNNGTTVENIILANPGVDLTLIYPGQQVVVPLSTPTPSATPTPLPTSTSTPGPDYPPPQLLTPGDAQVVSGENIIFNWTAPRFIGEHEFYVLHLYWPDGTRTEHWVKNTSFQMSVTERPANGKISWTVEIARRTDTSSSGKPVGITLSPPGETRMVEWK
jgi:LysM repeat protein